MLTDDVIKTDLHLPDADASLSKQVYFALLQEKISPIWKRHAKSYLNSQLEQAEQLESDLPSNPQDILQWMKANTESVGLQYINYLEGRHAGEVRRYFKSKSHALNFLKSVAPTKLVDGAWLYGLTAQWQDARFAELIRIYLEELGEGVPDKNHVVIYRNLLSANGCEQWEELSEEHYVQGAIQLAMAHHAAEFMPEVIGFNLGYEQLPLHLLISAYELNELGIDPYYFTLHVTVDNAATGHACRAVKALFDAMPQIADRKEFYRRVLNGYKLNMLGASTLSVIKAFSLENEIVSVFSAKSRIGCMMHSDYCRIGGRTVNDWLSDPTQIPGFLSSLEKAGWIKRHQDPLNSKFWKLIEGEHAEMFGVFNAYERQVIYDWIAGDYLNGAAVRTLNYKARKRLLDTIAHKPREGQPGSDLSEVKKEHVRYLAPGSEQPNDFNRELRLLEEQLAELNGKQELMASLLPLLSPAHHHTPSGLMATRIFNRYFSIP